MLRYTLAIALLATMPAAAQEPFKPIPAGTEQLYHIDFRNFYPSPDAEKADRAQTYASLEELKKLKGAVGASGENLLRALQLRETVTSRFNRHIIYRQLRFAVDMTDATSRQDAAVLQSELDGGIAFVRPELIAIPDTTLATYVKRVPELQRYAFIIAIARRNRPYTLSSREEELLGRAAALAGNLPAQLYQRATARSNPGTIEVNGKPAPVASLMNHPDPRIRETAWRRRQAAIEGQRDLYAMALIDIANTRNQFSKLRGFRNNVEQSYFDLFIEPSRASSLYDRILAHSDLYRRYQHIMAERARTLAGADSIHIWDSGLVDPNVRGTRFTVPQATRLIVDALAPMGTEVQHKLAALLDPKNGRIDIVAGPNRAPGAFAWGVPGLMTTFFYQSAFTGSYRDVSTLCHEASHAIHGEMLGDNDSLVSADLGPPYLSEGFAMFFELLLNDHMLAIEKDPARREYINEQFLWRTMLTFNVTRQAALEQAIYEGVQAGRISGPDDLDSVTIRVGKPVSIWYEEYPEMRNDWSAVQHYFNSPMYVTNYPYASILGLKLYAAYKADPAGFPPKFLALLKGGFTAPPDELLRRYLNFDLNDPRVVEDAVAVMAVRLGELEKAYAGN